MTDFTAASSIARTIRRGVHAALRQAPFRWSAARVDRDVSGALFAYNNQNNRLVNRRNSSRTQILRVGDIQDQLILNILEAIHQSSDDIELIDIEWSFVINAAAVDGAAGNIPVQAWWPASRQKSFVTWEDKDGPISCAAIALTIMMKPWTGYSGKKGDTGLVLHARKLQTEMGWEPYTTPYDILKFVEKYDTFRVAIMIPTDKKILYHMDGTKFAGAVGEEPKNCFYLGMSQVGYQRHYIALGHNPRTAFGKAFSDDYCFCHTCLEAYDGRKGHGCAGSKKRKGQDPESRRCVHCVQTGTHNCPKVTCRTCSIVYDKDSFEHRCLITMDMPDEKKNRFWQPGDPLNGSYTFAFVWDLETMMSPVENLNKQDLDNPKNHAAFTIDDNGFYTEVYEMTNFVDEHVAIAVAMMGLNDDSEFYFEGRDCVDRFISFVKQFNKGNVTNFAHNGSGYDNRFILQAGGKQQHRDIQVIPRGSKYLLIQLDEKVMFKDSMNFLVGSLRNLGNSLAPGVAEKGFFPYRFMTPDNWDNDYEGPPPALEYFGNPRTRKEFDELKEWHATLPPVWNLRKECRKYCMNDVFVLKTVCKSYMDTMIDMTGLNPFQSVTGAAFVLKYLTINFTKDLELPVKPETNKKDDEILESWKEQYKEASSRLLKKEWVVLKPQEYAISKAALHGGLTCQKKLHFKLSQKQIDDGWKISYIDVNSMYPGVQMSKEYPTGLPVFKVWDSKFFPCKKHHNEYRCACDKKENLPKELDVVDFTAYRCPTQEEIIRNHDFFGFAVVTMIPPKNIYHAVCPLTNERLGKVLNTLLDEDHVEIVLTTPELLYCFEMGYKLVQVHMLLQFKRGNNWEGIMRPLILEKLKASSAAPESMDERKRIEDAYEEFGMKEMIQKAWPDFKKDPARKMFSKITANSVWGKTVEQKNRPQTVIFKHGESREKLRDFWDNLEYGRMSLTEVIPLYDSNVMYRYSTNDESFIPNLHASFHPAGCFVPAYGRLQLLREMNKYGNRVLYHDTDSMIVVDKPGMYATPVSDILGGWGEEDISVKENHGGIVEYVSLGPKTYSVKCADGTEYTKTKGICCGLATGKLVNFEVMKGLVEDYFSGPSRSVKVPNMAFVFSQNKPGMPMTTWNFLKELKIEPSGFKGEFDSDGYLVPFGFEDQGLKE